MSKQRNLHRCDCGRLLRGVQLLRNRLRLQLEGTPDAQQPNATKQAATIAAVQIALLAHWLADVVPWRPEEMAQALIVTTRALLA